jgi:hypothetical protein
MAAIVYISAEEAEILLPINEYFLVTDYRGSCFKVMITNYRLRDSLFNAIIVVDGVGV